MLTADELQAAVEDGSIDTVVVAFTDMQGRLMGKRVDAEFFLDENIGETGVEGCNYLLALDMEMDPKPGYAIANWESGYGDFLLQPDLATLRRIPWLEATALVLCDVLWHDGTPVAPSPRQVLKRQVERAQELGFMPMFGSELEFYLFQETYAEAHEKGFQGLTPSVPYILDYHILATTYSEPLMRQIRNGMKSAGLVVESSKGEAWPGQQEVNFRYAGAITMADNHTVYKNGVAGESDVFKQYLAGQIACLKELAVFVAPTVNSYKRFAAESWAPTNLAWGHDNRTCGFRIVGHGKALRAETRIPGGDINPYLAFAALLAAGLYGIENELELPPPLEGNAYASEDAERFPSSLREAITALEEGSTARSAFGDDVVDHYLNYARTEQRLFDGVVTDWERERLFERG
jgi:glutamine synthetase